MGSFCNHSGALASWLQLPHCRRVDSFTACSRADCSCHQPALGAARISEERTLESPPSPNPRPGKAYPPFGKSQGRKDGGCGHSSGNLNLRCLRRSLRRALEGIDRWGSRLPQGAPCEPSFRRCNPSQRGSRGPRPRGWERQMWRSSSTSRRCGSGGLPEIELRWQSTGAW